MAESATAKLHRGRAQDVERRGRPRATRIALFGGAVAALLCAALVLLFVGVADHSVATPSTSAGLTLAQAPAKLRDAVRSPVARGLSASYRAGTATLTGAGWSGRVGLGQVGRSGAMTTVAGVIARSAAGARYGGDGVEESFTALPTGIEQSFTIARRPAGSGPLVIDVPLSGLSASGSGASIALHSTTGRTVGAYSGLRVTDAGGRVLHATMNATAGGHGIRISIDDASARYPLHVDPAYTQTIELNNPDTVDCSAFGNEVGISGATAVVRCANNPAWAFVYTLSGGTWMQTAVLHNAGGVGVYGGAVAISGTTIVLGDPSDTVGGNADQGDAFVYQLIAGTWTQTAHLTASDGAGGNEYGFSVATSGSTVAIGAPDHQGNLNGAVYVYTLSGPQTWMQSAELTPSDAGPYDQLGFSVGINEAGTTIVGGAVSGSLDTAYVFTFSGGSWAQTTELTPAGATPSDALPGTVAISGSTIALGNQYAGGTGEAFVYQLVGPTWTLETTLSPPGASFAGRALAISGSTIAVGAFGNSGNEGALYAYTGTGASWTLDGGLPLTASDGAASDELGFSVGISGDNIIGGAEGHTGGGAAYIYSDIQPGPLFEVTKTADSNDGQCYIYNCSLRDAIIAADAYTGSFPQIGFNIGSGAQTISVTSPLPAITTGVTMSATTQPGFAGTPLITLDGTGCTPSPCDGLDIDNTMGTLVRGLIISNFAGWGIVLNGGATNLVAGDWIGWGSPSILAGNGTGGIEVLNSSNNTIGGTTAADRVVVGGNGGHVGNGTDIDITGAGSTTNTVEGDWVALGPDGVTAADDAVGVQIDTGAANNTIGGSRTAGDGNLIFGLYQEGVYLAGAGTGNLIAGNTIGVNASGVLTPGAGPFDQGIGVENSPGTTIGDSAAPGTQANTANGNVIVNQTGDVGVFINSSYVNVAGNFVGTNPAGAAGLGNGEGIRILSGGGVIVGPGNVIANNSGDGVEDDTDANRVTANSIYGNTGAGITAPTDGLGEAAPVLAATSPQVSGSGTVTEIAGTVTGPAGSTVDVEFFDSPTCGARGSGVNYLGSVPVTIPAGIGTGSAPVSVATSLPVIGVGDSITATASTIVLPAPFPTTSAFSACSSVINGGVDNDAWTRAATITLNGSGQGNASGSIDLSGQARWYRFPVTPGGTVQVDLKNLPANYDLTLFSDIGQAEQTLSSTAGLQTLEAETPGNAFSPSVFSPSVFSPSVFSPSVFSPSVFSPSVFSPSVFSPSVFSPSVFSPSVFSPSVFSPSVFSPSVFSPSVSSPSLDAEDYEGAQEQSLLAVSDNPGTANQDIFQDIWNNTGYFYVRVNGPNGTYDPGAQFSLSVTENTGACGTPDPMSSTALLNSTVPGPSYKTLILTNLSRMTPDSDYVQMQNDLQTFAGLSSVDGTIVDVGTVSPRVGLLETQADDNPGCPYDENLVAEAIRDVVTAVRAQNPGLEYIVLIGDDHVIPFFRYPDTAGIGPESDYSPPVLDTTASYGSLESNDFLSQDAYGASSELNVQGLEIPIPDLPVGRLTETPTEIDGMLQAYLDPGTYGTDGTGVVPAPTSSLVTGYDFMTTGADAVEADFQAGLGSGATNDTLITNDGVAPSNTGTPPTQSWTAPQLVTALTGSRHSLIFLAGHFSANNTLAADYSTTMNANQLAGSSVNLENSIVFSAGCHSGYNIPAEDAVPGVTQTLDWVGAFAQKQATLIAGTGYQYGDTDFLAYSEKLYADFATALRYGSGPVAVGTALTEAKNAYLDSTQNLQGIDIKSLLEATLYGLPMTSVNLPSGRIATPSSTSIISSTTPFTSGPGAPVDAGGLGLSSTDVTLTPTLTTNTQQLESTSGGSAPLATYLSGPAGIPNGISTSPGAPTLPLAVSDVSVPGQVLRGVGFTGGTYTDQSGITPLTGAPATELSGLHSTFSSTAFFPSRLWSVNYFGGLSDGASIANLGTQATSAASGTGVITSLSVTPLTVSIPAGLTFTIAGDTNSPNIVFTTTAAAGVGSTSLSVSASQSATTTIAPGNLVLATDAKLMLTPAQYESDTSGTGTDVQRAYSSTSLRLFYSANTATYGANTPALANPPTIERVDASASDGTVTFAVHVDGDPSAGVQQVWITYTSADTTGNSSGQWLSVFLAQDPTDSTLWTGSVGDGSLTASQIANMQFVVQAVNGVGLVSLDDNQGSYYQPNQIAAAVAGGAAPVTPTSIQFTTTPPIGGPYNTTVSVSATLTTTGGTALAGEPVSFAIGGSTAQGTTNGSGVATAQIRLSDLPGGSYQLTAAFGGNTTLAGTSVSTSSFAINQLLTSLTLSAPSSLAYQATSSGISASLQSGGTGLAGDIVAFVFTPSGSTTGPVVTQTAETILGGTASLGALTLPPGTYSVQAYFGPGAAAIALPPDPIFLPSNSTSDMLTVTATTQTIMFNTSAPAATVGGPKYTPSATGGASGSPVVLTIDPSSSAICTIASGMVSFTAVGTCTIDANQAGGGIYQPAAQVQQKVTVGKGAQTITFNTSAPAATVGGPKYTPSATGGASASPVVLTIDPSSSAICTIASGVVSFAAVGTCTIDANQAGGTNYNAAAQVQQKVTVGKGVQTITFTSKPPTTPTVGGTYTLAATGGKSGNAVTFTIDSTSAAGACSISGLVVTFTGAGKCLLDANQAASANYNAATQAQQSLTVVVTASGVCTLTLTYVETSAAFKSLSTAAQNAIVATTNQGCASLNQITAHLTQAQINLLIAAFKLVVTALHNGGYLTAAQATTLDNAASEL
ncbi:MAG: hypothetical protein ABSD82_09360 [Solirubrobacteraceae bacterium]